MEGVRKGIGGDRTIRMTGCGLHTPGASRVCYLSSMNLKEQWEGKQQRPFQDVFSGLEGSLRQDTMFVNATKPGWCHGMICHFSARDDPSGQAVTKGMGTNVSIWHGYN